MRHTFREYFYEPADSLSETAVIVLDTNVLLDLFRMSLKSREELVAILGHADVKNRLWMPHQVGAEFFRNKDDVVHKFQKEIEELRASFKAAFRGVATLRRNRHKSDRRKDVKGRSRLDLNEIESLIQAARDNVDNVLKNALKEIKDSGEETAVLDSLLELYEGRVAPAPSEAERNEATRTAQQRFREGIPPGNLDVYKAPDTRSLRGDVVPASNSGNPYGDYFIWREIVTYAKQTKQSIVFVTGDLKSDWWQKVGGELRGPRKELIREFLDTTGQDINFHSPGYFYKLTADLLEAELADETKAELQSIEEQQEERTRTRRWPTTTLDGLAALDMRLLQPSTLADSLNTRGIQQLIDGNAGDFLRAGYEEAMREAERLTKGYPLHELRPLIDELYPRSMFEQYRRMLGFADEAHSDDEENAADDDLDDDNEDSENDNDSD